MEVIKLEQFQDDFNKATKNNPNRNLIIENEITEIKNFVNTIPNHKTWSKPIRPSHLHKANKIFDFYISMYSKTLFNEAFYGTQLNGSYKKEKEFHDTEETHEHNLKVVEQAYEFFKYYKWLNELLSTPQKAEKKNGLSHKQKILALHYLGFDMMQHNQTKTGLVLEEILELNAKNTTDYIRHVSAGKNNVRTIENLTKVKQLFEKQGLFDIADKINSEISKTK